MMETPEAAHERKAIRWDGTVTAGNLLTAIAMLVALLTWGFRLEAANAEVRNNNTSSDCSATVAGSAGINKFIINATSPAGTAAGQRLLVHWTADASL